MHFHTPDAQRQLDAMTVAQLDALAFGVVRMDHDGVVTFYNASEASVSGLSGPRVLGKHFFQDVAPCTNNYLVAQRYADEPELDASLDYVFTFRMRPTPVRLRLLRSASSVHQYLLVERVR
jgi:photoactive yellow protein